MSNGRTYPKINDLRRGLDPRSELSDVDAGTQIVLDTASVAAPNTTPTFTTRRPPSSSGMKIPPPQSPKQVFDADAPGLTSASNDQQNTLELT